MNVSAALVPSAPLLLRELTGTEDPAREVRTACAVAVTRLVDARPDVVHVIAAAGPPVTPSSFAPAPAPPLRDLGAPPACGGGGRARPLGLLVGNRLLTAAACTGEVIEHAVDAGQGASALTDLGRRLAQGAGRAALLVVGDGSARRGVKAPGYVDPRAEPFDASVLDAVARADAGALRAIDPALARELLVDGWAAWQVLAGVLDVSPLATDVVFADDPFGVFYLVASLAPRPRTDLP